MVFVHEIEKETQILFYIFLPNYPPNTPQTDLLILNIITIYSLSDEYASESSCLYSVMFKLTVSINYLQIHSYIKRK